MELQGINSDEKKLGVALGISECRSEELCEEATRACREEPNVASILYRIVEKCNTINEVTYSAYTFGWCVSCGMSKKKEAR